MENKLKKIKEDALLALKDLKSQDAFLALEKKFLGRKGKISEVMKSLVDLSQEEKKKVGQLANQIKKELQSRFSDSFKETSSMGDKDEYFDVTLPGIKNKLGHLHPLTQIQRDMEEVFKELGFSSLEGPELESDYYNFEALNVAKDHPARDMQDTFYIDKKNKDGEKDLVMRTQTSPMQIRAMKKYGAPLRVIVPGRCFRNEATDIRHEHTFYQLEGLMIGEDINFSHLRGVLELVGKKLFGEDAELRMRPKFYPFVEPGANGEYKCFVCSGKGCNLCKGTGWLEVIGSGMVHPNVLRAGGIDPEKYQGFAFGFGLTRMAQLKYGVEDVRLFNSGDLRFLEQF